MKRVVNGKLYNTETAQEIGNASYSYKGDFNHWDETLYRTKKGCYFIAGHGGPNSQYCKRVGQNEYCGGSDLYVLDMDEARSWAERYLSVKDYTQFFEVEEG